MLSADDVRYEFNKEIAKSAVMAQARAARRGWLLRILPAAILLIVLTLGGVQLATGIPVQDVFTGDTEGASYSSGKLTMARMIVLGVLLVVAYWLYETYREGGKTVSGALVGGDLAANPIMNTVGIAARQQYQHAQASVGFTDDNDDAIARQYVEGTANAMAAAGGPQGEAPPLTYQQAQNALAAPAQPSSSAGSGQGPYPAMMPGLPATRAGGGGPMGKTTLAS